MLTSKTMRKTSSKKENNDIDELKYYIDSFGERELTYEEDLKAMIYLKLKLSKTEVVSNKIKPHLNKFLSAYERFYLTLI